MPHRRLRTYRRTRPGRLAAGVAATLVIGAFVLLPPAHGAAIKTSHDVPGAGESAEYVPGEVVVWFADATSAAHIDAAVERAGGNVVARSAVTPSRVVLAVPAGQEESYAKRYRGLRSVRAAERNYVFHALWKPNDPLYRFQWHFNKPDFIYAEEGWDTERGDAKVVVAVIDTGVAYENNPIPDYERDEVNGSSYVQAPDLAGTKFVAGYDFIHDDEHPNDQNGHGTHVSGTIAQTTNNNLNVAGLGHLCSIMPIQALDNSGGGTSSDIADAIDFARKKGVHVVNMSFGGSAWTEVIKSACDDAEAAGLVLVAASGNDGADTVLYPAGYDSVIAVGAVDYDGELTWYSNYGVGQELVAPGGDTLVDLNNDGFPDGVLQMTYDQMYEPGLLPGFPEALANVTTFTSYFLQGTSMASPHAAGLAALIVASGYTDNEDVRKKLRGSATDKGLSGYDVQYGYGLINCKGALEPGVPEVDEECGNCAQLSLAEIFLFFGLFFGAYGLIFVRRKFKA
jgi:serine protease